ncbi:DnaJ-like protein [Halanaerobium saccharolyticum]|uniref:DnaJ-like protein n=2 Tax=Halanaerobium saccharolyticum TaxID=43595 RepID=A0A4V3G532_9FIRM|nr:DnaJ-like protein [Halanaerobium saccharolyticum]TDW03083.1 DnaJ-like protein [Halanaerobium saccharolyticum]TDX59379.1 DnaJ-like protein [Halanaerobium saccharolyticum]
MSKKKEFNLNKSSPKELRKELRRKLANLHPDKNKGDSSTDRFKQVNHAMEYLDEFLKKETDLVINEEDNEIYEKYKPRLSNIIMHLKSNKREFGIPFNPRGNINIELAQELANTVFFRAENNNVIKMLKSNSKLCDLAPRRAKK